MGVQLLPGERGPVDRFAAQAHTLITAEKWAAAWQDGGMMGGDEAIAYAFDEMSYP
jgi:hypothetical protein